MSQEGSIGAGSDSRSSGEATTLPSDTKMLPLTTASTADQSANGGDEIVEKLGNMTIAHNGGEVAVASAVNGGREISNTVLYVGNIPKTVNEQYLHELFDKTKSVKLLHDKNKPGFNYAFVEFDTREDAESVLTAFNGSEVGGSSIKINWAYQLSTISTSSSPELPLYTIFVGDLSAEVDDETLGKAFDQFPSRKQAHVMWDMQTSRSRGYGFVSFADPAEAENALVTMPGLFIGGRAIRCNWASHRHMYQKKNTRPPPKRSASAGATTPPLPYTAQGYPIDTNNGGRNPQPHAPKSFEVVLRQAPNWQTTVYLGNIAHFTHLSDLIPLLQNFGFIVDFKFHPSKGCAFVKYDSHERAALAIVQLAGYSVNGRPLKCGWGRDRPIAPYQGFRYGAGTI